MILIARTTTTMAANYEKYTEDVKSRHKVATMKR